MNPIGSKSFQFNGLDWQAVKRTAYRGLGGVALALIPLLISPEVHYSFTIGSRVIDYTVVIAIIGTTFVRAIEAWFRDNSLSV